MIKRITVPLLFCANLSIFYFYDYLLRVMPSVVSNGLYHAYHLSFASYGYICTAFYLVYVPMQLILGIFIDRIDCLRFMALSILCCSLGCYLFANSNFLWLALSGRFLMGLGASGILLVVLKQIGTRVSERRFTIYLGMVICIGMLGGLLMDSALVFVFRAWGWRLACYALALLGLALTLIRLFQARAVDKQPSIHFKHEFNQLGRYLINKRLWVQCLIGALLYLPIAGFAESWGIYFLKYTNQLSHVHASMNMSLLFLGFAVGAPLLGWIYDRTKQYQLILTVGSIGVTILLSIVLYIPEMSNYKIGLSLFLLGLFSSALVVIFALNRKLADKQNVGKVFAVTNFFIMFAGGVTWLLGELVQLIVRYGFLTKITFCSLSQFQLAFIILPLASLLAVFLSFYVYDRNT